MDRSVNENKAIAELVSVSPDKTAILIFRPTLPMHKEWMDQLSQSVRLLRQRGGLPAHVSAIVIPAGVDVIVIGEADLQRGISIDLAGPHERA